MATIITNILKSKRPFVYFHTHEVTLPVLQMAIDAKGTIEIDVSADESGKLYIGHPLSFYEYKHLPHPDNLSLDYVINSIEKTELIVVLDCKDKRAVDWIRQTIERLGSSRVIVHAWVDTLLFKPYDASLAIEPHWIYEDLELNLLTELHKYTGVALILSCRGLSNTYIDTHYNEVIEQISRTVSGMNSAVNLNLPNNSVASQKLLSDLIARGIITLQNVDTVPETLLPNMYIGMTDDIRRQSV